jgi:formamidopyrimidine-DNA glycosylase
MPELPEVEIIRRGMERPLENKVIKTVRVIRHDLRVPVPENFAADIAGQTCLKLVRRGKYIIMYFSNDVAAILHLGMSGRIHIYPPDQQYTPLKHDHIVLITADHTHIAFNDPRRFGMFYLADNKNWAAHPPFAAMGPEPLEGWDGAMLHATLRNRKSPIKTALLDQRIVCGLGNIYVCEALFNACIHPERAASTLSKPECVTLASCAVAVLEKAIAAGGSTLRDYKQTDGSLGYFQHHFAVYDQEHKTCPRPKCNGTIQRIVQAGRSTFYCPTCQK